MHRNQPHILREKEDTSIQWTNTQSVMTVCFAVAFSIDVSRVAVTLISRLFVAPRSPTRRYLSL
jgi:hypothetical protein